MNNLAQTRTTKLESFLSTQYLLPGVLAANTMALLALERLGAFPDWVKAAAALFLSF